MLRQAIKSVETEEMEESEEKNTRKILYVRINHRTSRKMKTRVNILANRGGGREISDAKKTGSNKVGRPRKIVNFCYFKVIFSHFWPFYVINIPNLRPIFPSLREKPVKNKLAI